MVTASAHSLHDTEVLVVDCQTTGAAPDKGNLIELSWCRTRGEGDIKAVSHLVALPPDDVVPRRITALTGLKTADLSHGLQPAEVWHKLCQDVADLTSPVPAIAHYARFERSFLRPLHPGDDFPLELLCTVDVARRLLPDLPRRSLRALAGYFGHHAREHKRAGDHVRATITIWRALVQQLADHGVTTWEELRAWLKQPAPRPGEKRSFPLERERRLALPDAPGVYRMLGRGGKVLYLGKATSLKRRVNSYFQKRRGSAERTLELLTQTWDIKVTETGSPLEAALVEVDAIKRHDPPYNVALRGRDPRVWFATQDLRRVGQRPGGQFLLGPLPGRDPLAPLHQLCELLEGGARQVPSARARRRALGIPEGFKLPEEAFVEGLLSFVQRHGLPAGLRPTTAGLLRLGARIWHQRRLDDQVEEEALEEPEEQERASRSQRVWTPERVDAGIESNLVRAAHLLRRAHWLCQLAEATVVWRPRSIDRGLRCLVVVGGRVARVDELSDGGTAPPPPGWRRAPLQRMRRFDSASYDRLRVLTTEIRRVVGEGAPVTVCLGPGQRLGSRALARRLFWV